MKYVKMLGLAAMAAMALMAFGAGSASAATLFSTGVAVPAGTTIHAEFESGELLQSTTDDKTIVSKCKKGTISGTTSNLSGTTVDGLISAPSFTECTNTTHSDENAGGGYGTLSISQSGTVTGTNSVVTSTFSGIVCKFGTAAGGTHLGTLTTGKLTINAVINEQEPKKFICPDTTKWVANYKVTTPHDLTAGV